MLELFQENLNKDGVTKELDPANLHLEVEVESSFCFLTMTQFIIFQNHSPHLLFAHHSIVPGKGRLLFSHHTSVP